MTSVIVVSQAIHPAAGSAEGIVTGALVDALRSSGLDVAVVSEMAYEPMDGSERPADECRRQVDCKGWISAGLRSPKASLRGAIARSAERAGSVVGARPASVSGWADPAAIELLNLRTEVPPSTVVWARGLPEASLAAALRARRRQEFPLICSLGDPLPTGRGGWTSTDARVARLALSQVRSLADLADAWTFPCRAVAEPIVAAGGLDASRCFVLPHVVADSGHRSSPVDSSDVPTVAYVGSAYRWVLSGSLLPALQRASEAGILRPVLAFRGIGDADLDAVRAAVPGAIVLTDLDPRDASALVAGADAMLLPTARPDLLYTKVVEALRLERPVLAICSTGSTTERLVSDAGGIVVDTATSDADDLDRALRELVGVLDDPDRVASRRAVAARLSPDLIAGHARALIDYASALHAARSGGKTEPRPPDLPAWP